MFEPPNFTPNCLDLFADPFSATVSTMQRETFDNLPAPSLTWTEHRCQLERIVQAHLDEAEARVDFVYRDRFSTVGAVFKRHWRNRNDVPVELASLPRSVWRLSKSQLARMSKSDSHRDTPVKIDLTGKQEEIRRALEVELLDLPGLDKKLAEHVAQYQQAFDRQLNEVLLQLSTEQRELVEKTLQLQVERMTLPVEGAREALMLCLTALIGRGVGSTSFGSSIGAGQAIATAWYTSNLGWWGSIWAGLTGVPGWVSAAGATGGFLAALVVAPILAPFLELGINRWRARAMLVQTIEHFRRKVVTAPSDTVDVLGRLAVYLQVLPDVLHFAIVTASKVRP